MLCLLMPIIQTVEIPANRRLTIDVPPEVPTGRTILTFTPAFIDTAASTDTDECPECAKYRDPGTGELRFNAETMAGMQEVEDMISMKVPAKWYNSLEEMMVDLEKDD